MKILSRKAIHDLRKQLLGVYPSDHAIWTAISMAELHRRHYRQRRRDVRRRPKTHLTPTDWLTNEQLARVFEYVCRRAADSRARGERYSRAITNEMSVLLLAETGLRAAEALNLRMDDLPCCHGHNEVFVREGKGRYPRSVGISSFLAERIKLYAGELYKRRDFFLRNERGGPLSYASLFSKIKHIGLATGVMTYTSNGKPKTHLSPHKFRHTFATNLVASTENNFLVQSQLGHRHTDTTKIYVRTVDGILRSAMKSFHNRLWQNVEGDFGQNL